MHNTVENGCKGFIADTCNSLHEKEGQLVFFNFTSEFVDFDCSRLNPSSSMTCRDGAALLER